MRLLSLAPSHTELVYALGAESQLVGRTSYCDFPGEAGALPSVPGWSSIKVADVLALKPDLVLTSSLCQEGLRHELEDAGLNLVHFDPRTLPEVLESFMELGELLGLQEKGKALANSLARGLEVLARQAEGMPRPRIYIEEWNQPPMAAGNWVPELVLAAGAEPFNRSLGRPSEKVTWEEVVEFDPEIVAYSICGLATGFDPSVFLRTEGFAVLSAAQSGRVFSVDDSLFNRPGPRLLEGAALLQGLISECFWQGPKLESGALRRLAPIQG